MDAGRDASERARLPPSPTRLQSHAGAHDKLRQIAMIPPALRRLLLIFAHPDDESVFAAGLACRTVAGGDAGRVE